MSATTEDRLPEAAALPDPASEPRNPFERARGLVGGDGAERARHRIAPVMARRTTLNPYDVPGDLELAKQFAADGEFELEIGFGRPHFIRDRILQAPERKFLAFEVRRAWCEQLADFLDAQRLDNTRVFLADARPLLPKILRPLSVHAAYVFFPDPWWKKRHEKRRVVTTDLLDVLYELLAPEGVIEVRTDVAPYFERVQALFAADPRYQIVPAGVDALGRELPLSHREKKCAENGVPAYRIAAAKRAA
jgi:tRNA (guanine-N7-)-methyltransferase